MKKFIIYIILLLNVAYLQSQQWKTINIEGNIYKIKILTLRSNEYLSIATISNFFFSKSKLNPAQFTIEFNSKTLRFAPSSVFSALLSTNDSLIFQMRQPAIYYNNELYIPFNSFLLSLEIFQLYKVEMLPNEIKLTKYLTPIEKNNLSDFKDKLPLINESNTSTKKITKTTQNNEVDNHSQNQETQIKQNLSNPIQNEKYNLTDEEIKKISDITPPPNSYKLPKDLDRGNLSEISQKLSINENELFITNYYFEQNNNSLIFVISANKIIEQYQKPESTNNKIIIKIPNAKNGITKFDIKNSIINNIDTKTIDGTLIYSLELNKNPKEYSLKRNGPKELILKLQFHEENI